MHQTEFSIIWAASDRLLVSVGIVAFVFIFGLGIIWCLEQFGRPVGARVKGGFSSGSAHFAMSGGGLIGAYLAIIAAVLAGVFLVNWILR